MTPVSPSTTSAPTEAATAAVDHIRALLAHPGTQVNLERHGGRFRVRYRLKSARDEKNARKSLELPPNEAVVVAVQRLIEEHRRSQKRVPSKLVRSRTPPELDALRRRVLDACPHGRVMRRRIALVFRIASGLGYEALVDFLKREPWLARPNHAGRPRRRDHV